MSDRTNETLGCQPGQGVKPRSGDRRRSLLKLKSFCSIVSWTEIWTDQSKYVEFSLFKNILGKFRWGHPPGWLRRWWHTGRFVVDQVPSVRRLCSGCTA